MFRAVVRYGRLRHLAEFSPSSDAVPAPRPKSRCVVETDRGSELGEVLALATGASTSEREYVRGASPEDLERAREAGVAEEHVRSFAQERADFHGLALRVVSAEKLFSGERLFLYYVAEDRLDLRELARELQVEAGTRVELRQLGARERARACGGTGVCGRALCCSTFLRVLEPVTIRMAKVQGFSLSPDATQGVCGRLKCCLRYENPLYEESRALLPRIGAFVEAARASGEVVGISALARKVTVRTPDGRLVDLFAAEVVAAKTLPLRLPLAPASLPLPLPLPENPEASEESSPPVEEPKPKDSRWRGITRRLFGFRAKKSEPEGSDKIDAPDSPQEPGQGQGQGQGQGDDGP